MQKLNLPDCALRIENRNGQLKVFDTFRKLWVVLTPEEWVRQNFLHFLTKTKGYPGSLISVEKQVKVNGMQQRFDFVVYNRIAKPLMVGEFKAPGIRINQDTFDQAVRYNGTLKAPFVLVSNGLDHFICRIDFEANRSDYLSEIPDFESIAES